jgi:hypothetical protein
MKVNIVVNTDEGKLIDFNFYLLKKHVKTYIRLLFIIAKPFATKKGKEYLTPMI